MSFSKAGDLLRLARLAAARRDGVSLDDIRAEFEVSHRTAQRMTDALETVFAGVSFRDGEDRRRRWRVEDPALERFHPRRETAIEALDVAAGTAGEEGRLRHARALGDIREALLARLLARDALRSETDAEAVLSALSHIARPGPRVALDPDVTDAVIEALRGPFRLRVVYGEPDAAPRVLEPHGLLLGHRSYLVARQTGRDDTLRNFRMDRIHIAKCLDESFALAASFSLEDYAAKAFGVWQDPQQCGEVVWRYRPEAAARAAEFRFHPRQSLEPQPDGALVVRFHAAGWLEIAWHLYQWGDAVEVLHPPELRAMVEGHRRSDFGALP
ncbi:MAG: WYL domain-containing protein [Pseudomonadota bacterium]